MAESLCHYLSEFALYATGISVDVVNKHYDTPFCMFGCLFESSSFMYQLVRCHGGDDRSEL